MMLLVTVEDLGWTAIEDAMKSGDLPFLAGVLRESALFQLRPEAPHGSCSCWPTIATGAAAIEHGVTYPMEAWAGGLRRSTSASWLRPPVWQTLAEKGFETASVAFPFARPGNAWAGTHVDERIVEMSGMAWEDWPLPLDVAPRRLRDILRDARVHSSDVHPQLLGPFARQEDDLTRTRAMASALAKVSTLTGVVQTVGAECRPDFMAVHLDWPHMFKGLAGSSQPAPAFWALLDGALRNLRGSAGSPSSLMLVSPGSAGEPGFIVVHPSATGGHQRGWATLRDVAPTILEQFGLSDPRLQGRSLLPCGKILSTVEIEWAKDVNQPCREDCSRVEALGYVVPTPPHDWPSPKLLAEAELVLEQDPALASEKVEEALSRSPRSPQGIALAGLLAFAKGDADRLQTHADALAALDTNDLRTIMLRAGVHVLRKERREAAPLLRRIQAEGNRDDRLRVAGAWLMLGSPSNAKKLLEAIVEEDPFCVPAMLALASQMEMRPFDAEQLLRRVLAIQPDHAAARRALADILTAFGKIAEAQSVRGDLTRAN